MCVVSVSNVAGGGVEIIDEWNRFEFVVGDRTMQARCADVGSRTRRRLERRRKYISRQPSSERRPILFLGGVTRDRDAGLARDRSAYRPI